MKAIYTVLHGNVFRIKQKTDIPNTITQKTPGVSSTVNTDSATKAVTQYVEINALETPAIKSNRELYEDVVAYLKKNRVTNIKTIQNFFKIYMDYTMYDGNKEVEHSAVIKPITPVDMILPLGVATNSECVYRRVKTFEPTIEFRLKHQLPYGIMQKKDERYTFKINNVCIFQDFSPSPEIHNSVYETPYQIGSDTLNHNLESMAMIYSTANEGIDIQPIRLNFSPRTMSVKFDITLCNFFVAYDDADINKILLDNINEKYNPDQGDIEVPEDDPNEGNLIPPIDPKPSGDGQYCPDENGMYQYYQRCKETTPDSLQVVEDLFPDEMYDTETMIRISMVVKDIADIEVGEYVLLVTAVNVDQL